MENQGEVIFYNTEDGSTHIEVKVEDETVWLTINQMSELFGKSRSTINEHILNVFSEGELLESESVRKIGNSDFSTKPTNYYNLDVIISVGYRVKSIRGTQFRRWATERLKEYMIVQNKLHFAAQGHTAAEVIYERADAEKPFKGLTSFAGELPALKDISVAKNYLSEDELKILNNLVSGYFDLAEINAIEHKPMYMNDYHKKKGHGLYPERTVRAFCYVLIYFWFRLLGLSGSVICSKPLSKRGRK